MTYYLAPSLARLRAQVNELWPGRDKTSDGWIGDPSHQARKSDHNPDYSSGGVVRALDIDVDGIDVDRLLDTLIHDNRVSYVIYNRRIWGGTRWRPYSGDNPHTKHIHVSIKHTKAAESGHAWIMTDYAAASTTVTPSEELSMADIKEITGKLDQIISGIESLRNSIQSEQIPFTATNGRKGETNMNGALRDIGYVVRDIQKHIKE